MLRSLEILEIKILMNKTSKKYKKTKLLMHGICTLGISLHLLTHLFKNNPMCFIHTENYLCFIIASMTTFLIKDPYIAQFLS